MARTVNEAPRRRSRLWVLSVVLPALVCSCVPEHSLAERGAREPTDADLVLPGFVPLTRRENTIALHAREYRWQESFIPAAMDALGAPLAKLVIAITAENGERHDVQPDSIVWHSTTPAKAVYTATGKWRSMGIEVRASVEYDGVVDANLSLKPEAPVAVREVALRMRVARRQSSVAMGYSAANIRRQKDRTDALALPYRGSFLNAVTVADGDRSFWWFADSQRGWLTNPGEPITKVWADDDAIHIAQRIVAGEQDIAAPIEIRFGLLATPVKPWRNEVRSERATSKSHSAEQARLKSKFKLWWPTAFAYDAYPYTDYAEAPKTLLPLSDIEAYPGLQTNLSLVRTGRERFDFHWLPYFSAHVLSLFDPAVERRRAEWEILPERVFRDGLLPYSNRFDKPVMTHNAPGYSNHVLSRFHALIDELDIEGVYLDHGPPHDSNNPLNGGWADTEGKMQPALDIFALRDFLRRLRTLFVERGKQGYTFIHVSNREIMPAYTFAHAVVDGEQFKARVTNGAYLDVMPLEEFRTRLAGTQYGIPNYWLPSDWANHRGDARWKGSERQRLDYRRVMALALLHDVPLWQHGYHVAERERLLTLLDALPVSAARFTGYWHAIPFLAIENSALRVSQYRAGNRVLNVIVNTSASVQTAGVGIEDPSARCRVTGIDRDLSDLSIAPRGEREIR